ncbi:MAG: trypsin-like peptidase domain-containing protein, partial [Gemmatimonadetes bacterium]|nr:trypsin-like peptidase domain-containing protein [Gemmatimonadota bacterium]
VKDLESRNGTLVNGHRITAETRIDDTDQIRFGPEGPLVEFRAVPDSVPDTPRPTFEQAAPAGAPAASSPTPETPMPRVMRTTDRIRFEVARQTQKLKWVSAALLVLLVSVLAGFYVVSAGRERQREALVVAMQTRVDSIMRASEEAVRSLQGQLTGLADALRQSQTQVQQLQTQLVAAQTSGDKGQVAALARRLDSASTLLRNQQVAAQVDYRSIIAANQLAVAIIYVEFAPGEVFTGTAFAVRPDGIMLTNRHVVAGKQGDRTPTRIGIHFADSRQNFPAEVLAISPEVDLAVLRVHVGGVVPTVKAIRSSGEDQPGDPVAVIGFPLGIELPMLTSRGSLPVAKTTFAAGTLSKVLPDLIQIDGYGAEGSSGSPIFNRNGEVIAILYGGQEGTGGRVVFSVPASYAAKLLASIN